MKSDVQVCKKVSDALVKQVGSLERQCWTNASYSRRESAEIIGMSNWIVHSALANTVCKVLQHIGADICEEKLELYHRINKKRRSGDNEIFWRKDCEQVMRVKKDLKDLNPDNLDFPEGTWLFINDTLHPYYRIFWINIKN